jgi:hypothetical protein
MLNNKIQIPNDQINPVLLKLFTRDVINHSIKTFGIKYGGPCSITTVRQGKRYLVNYSNGQITVEQYVNADK